MANYIVELQALFNYCNFGDTLELMLKDRIVCGINNIQIQKHLLAEKNLTYAKAKEIALDLESAVQSTMDIKTPSSDTVHKMTEKRQKVSNVTDVAKLTTRLHNVNTRILCVMSITKQVPWLRFIRIKRCPYKSTFKETVVYTCCY